jgi:glutamate racemase
MKIAFFDSGIGGLTVLSEAIKLIPNEKYIYYSDPMNAPYGSKSKDEVVKLTLDAVSHLAPGDIKALVVACNTATSAAIDVLRKEYQFPVIGMEPAVKLALAKNRSKKVLVLATSLTLREEKFNSLIKRLDSEDKVDMLPLQKLVEYAEKRIFFDGCVYTYLRESFKGYELDNYSSIVLGCTHFSFFRKQIGEVTNFALDIIDGNQGVARQLKKVLNDGNMLGNEFGFEVFESGRKITDESLLNGYWDMVRSGSV